MIRALDVSIRSEPSRSNSPYSSTRKIFTWARGLISEISSKNSVPPSASSNFPLTLCCAPVNAPRSWPNSWLSSKVSLIADALNAMNGPFVRAEELWMACASKVFPVPVSPRRTTGTSVFAASAASCKQRAMASLLVVRSSILNLESGSCIVIRELLPHVLPQLPDWFERIFDQRPSTDDDVRFASHSHAERQNLPWTGGNHRTI